MRLRRGAERMSRVSSTQIRAIVGCGSGVVDRLVDDGVGAALVRPCDDRVGDEAGARSRHREHPVRHAAPPGGLADRPDRGKADDGDRGRGATSAACRNPGALQPRRAVVPAAGRAGRPHERLHGGAHARAASDPGRGSRRRGERRRSRERVPRRCANDCAARRSGAGGRPDRRTRRGERPVRRCCHLRSRRDRRRLVRATEETDDRGRGARAACGCQVHPSKQAARRPVHHAC